MKKQFAPSSEEPPMRKAMYLGCFSLWVGGETQCMGTGCSVFPALLLSGCHHEGVRGMAMSHLSSHLDQSPVGVTGRSHCAPQWRYHRHRPHVEVMKWKVHSCRTAQTSQAEPEWRALWNCGKGAFGHLWWLIGASVTEIPAAYKMVIERPQPPPDVGGYMTHMGLSLSS